MSALIRVSICGLVLCTIVVSLAVGIGHLAPTPPETFHVDFLGPGPGGAFRFALYDRSYGLKANVTGHACCHDILPSNLSGSGSEHLVARLDRQAVAVLDLTSGIQWRF